MTCNIYFYLKRGLWTTEQTVQFFFSIAQLRCFWQYFCFRSETSLTPASVHSLWSSPKCFNQLCLTVFSSLQSSLLLVHIFLPNFFLPVNFAFNMIWYSTPWTATPFSNDPLWLTLFVEGVKDRLLDHGQVSSVPHYCGFKKQDAHNLYSRDGHLIKLKYKYSNILIYWISDFHKL